jgi:uncharacterized protein (TIGR03067 family)/predicted Zn finger-like uncharacterized protein
MASTNIQCPSCEAGFAVKDSLIGKKVDCPKCKYRFKAELPEDDDAPRVKKADKAKKKGGSNTLVIGGVIGALALILLAVGAVFIFGGFGSGDSPKAGGAGSTSTPPRTGSPDGGGAGTGDGSGTPGEGTTTPDGGEPTTATGGTTPDNKPKGVKPGNLKHASNLLHGEAISVYCIYAERLLQTPLFNSVFDRNTQEFFRNSLTFDAADIETYHHCVVNPDRTPFGVFRLKKPLDELALLNKIENMKGPLSPIKGRSYNTIKSNAFLDAIGRALSSESVRNEMGIAVTEDEKKKWAEDAKKPLAFHVYDSQTLIVADQLDLERFLQDLDDKGDPPMKSILAPDAPPPESQPMPGDGGPGAAPGGAPGGGGTSGVGALFPRDGKVYLLQGRGRPGGPGAPGAPGGPPGGDPRGGGDGPGSADGGATPGQGGAPRPRRSFTSNPHYRTVDEQLKFMLNRLEDEDPNNPPAIIYAEILDQRFFNNRQFGALFRATGDALFGLLSQIKVVGAAIRVFNKDKFVASAAFEFQNEADARQATGRFIQPLLDQLTPLLSLFLGTPIEVRNNAQGGGQAPGAFGPGGPGGEPGAGGNAPPPPGLVPGGVGGPGGPPRGGVGSPDGGDPRGGAGQGFGPGGAGTGAGSNPSFISVSLSDKATILGMEILWNEERYKRTILPLIVSLANQLKGRMAVLSGETTWHSLAAAFPKLKAAGNKPFPRGTLEREVVAERFGMPFPPEQRVSFLADLLPFLGKGGLRSTIQEKKFPWYAKENLPAAESWVPEFLVPYYPQTAWRASHPMAEGKVLGATNFVGLAGLGLDAARYNPNSNPEHAKKVGISGYDWGSTPAEITDGMSNTIYLIQAPPGVRRAWIAGGGATLVGVDDTLANPISDFVHTAPDKKRGTYVMMADGSVRWVAENVDAKVFKGMVTRAGGETLGEIDKLTPKVDPPKGTKVEIRGGAATAPKGSAPAPSDAAVLDPEELKKFQGDWKVTLLVVKGVRVPTEQLEAAKIVLTFEGEMMRAESPLLKDGLPNGRITRLDNKTSPHVMHDETTSGPEKGKKDTSVYEFVGPNKLKVRSAEDGKPTPKQVIIPEASSKDSYFELERILKD